MKIFITGASGFIASHTIPLLLTRGHTILALARSPSSAAALAALSPKITVVHGSLTDLEVLAKAAGESDAVIHLGFVHDFANMGESCRIDVEAIEAMGGAMEGSGKRFIGTSGTLGLLPAGEDGFFDETSGRPEANMLPGTRGYSEKVVLGLNEHGVCASFVRLCPSTHGPRDHGFLPMIIAGAKKNGFAGYIGDGVQRWSAGHVDDAAELYCLAVESAPGGSVLHAVGDEAVTIKSIAEVIGKKLGLEVKRVEKEDAVGKWGFIGMVMGMDGPCRAERTKELLGWKPLGWGLLEDLEKGDYLE